MQNIISDFNNQVKDSSLLKNEKSEAFETFTRLGFPTLKHEEWKYTNLKKITGQELKFSVKENGSVTKEMVENNRIAGKDVIVVVFENGIFRPELSDAIRNESILIKNLAAASSETAVKEYLGKIATYHNETFVALNTSFMNDGIFIHITGNQVSDIPVHFMHFNSHTGQGDVSTVRNLIIAEKNSKTTFVESYHSTNNTATGFTNCVNEILIKEGAGLELVKAQLESGQTSQVNFTQVIQEKNSLFDGVTITLSGALVRNNLHILLRDVNCTSHLYGLYILDDHQIVDNHTLVDHAMPHCMSHELYKGLIGGHGAGVFNGKIFVRKDAQKTNAYQSNKNILLSDHAQVNTKPQLEIFADDVKCTHGATTGQMDDEALFYLRSRGIGEMNARTMLNIAFAGDVLNNIKEEILRENLLNLAVEKLHNNGL